MELQGPEEALASFDKAASLRPAAPEAWNYRGNVLKHLKRHDEALSSFNRTLALKSDFLKAFYFRAELFRDLGRHDEALLDAEAYEHLLFARVHGYAPRPAKAPQFLREGRS